MPTKRCFWDLAQEVQECIALKCWMHRLNHFEAPVGWHLTIFLLIPTIWVEKQFSCMLISYNMRVPQCGPQLNRRLASVRFRTIKLMPVATAMASICEDSTFTYCNPLIKVIILSMLSLQRMSQVAVVHCLYLNFNPLLFHLPLQCHLPHPLRLLHPLPLPRLLLPHHLQPLPLPLHCHLWPKTLHLWLESRCFLCW